jgi:hypothetical protein
MIHLPRQAPDLKAIGNVENQEKGVSGREG